MKAAVFYGIGDLRVEEIETPRITEEEILIRVRSCAVCGTDLRIFNYGHFKIPEGARRILGHEVAGEIVETGTRVRGYRTGMRVALPPNVGCGTCPMCLQGFNNLCPDYEAFGISMDGGFAEYMKVPVSAIRAGNVISFPDHVSFEEATLAEPLSCCYNSYKALKTEPTDTVLIVGAGPVGALHLLMNRLAGAGRIIVADISVERLERMKAFGADTLIDSSQCDLVETIKQETGGRGADVIITACSVPQLQNQALIMAAAHGRINFFGGLPKGREEVTLNTNLIHYKELVALGTTGSSILHFTKALNIIAAGNIDVKPLISARFNISHAKEAFEYAASGTGMKALIINN